MNTSLSRRAFLAQTVAGATLTTLPLRAETASLERPNILCFVSEDNCTDLGCYGCTQVSTPNLDRLAQRGILFDHCIGMPVCSVSRFSLLTGCQPMTHNAQHHRSTAVPFRLPQLYPETLRNAGYYTINTPKTDYNYPFPLKHLWSSAQKGGTTDWAKRPKGMPFVAIYNYAISHESHAFGRNRPQDVDPDKISLPPWQPDLPENRLAYARYLDSIQIVDRWVGEQLEKLRRSPEANNTIVLYYSDNGGHTFRTKRFLHMSGLHCSLIMYFPPKWRHLAPKGAVGGHYAAPVHFVDIPATILSLCGLKVPESMAGRSFAGQTQEIRKIAFSSRDRMDERYDMSRCAYDGRYLYVRHFRPDIPAVEDVNYALNAPGYRAMFDAFRDNRLTPEIRALFLEKKPEELYDTLYDDACMNNRIGDPVLKAVSDSLRCALFDEQVLREDQGLVPENEPHRTDIKSLCRLAWIASERSMENAKILIGELTSPDADRRRWGAIGLAILGKQAATAQPALTRAFEKESCPVAKIEMAYAAIRVSPGTDHRRFVRYLVCQTLRGSLPAGNELTRLPPEELLPFVDRLRAGIREPPFKRQINIMESVARRLNVIAPKQL